MTEGQSRTALPLRVNPLYSRFGIFCSAAVLARRKMKVTTVEISTMNSE